MDVELSFHVVLVVSFRGALLDEEWIERSF
jgi:hypothetical protein